jgi:hypothetical protein
MSLTRTSTVFLLAFLPAPLSAGGRIVASHDVNTLSSQCDDAMSQVFVVNVARFLAGSQSGSILAIESYPDGYRNYAPGIRTALANAGFSVTYASSTAFTLPELQEHDAVFSGALHPSLTGIDGAVLAAYVRGGGNVYVYGGTGPDPAAEARVLNSFLSSFGLEFSPAGYNGITSVKITSPHVIFDGVTTLCSGVGQSIRDLGTNPDAEIVQFAGDQGVYAVVWPCAFIRGDVNSDRLIEISDPISILTHLFLGKPSILPCEKSADADDGGAVEMADALYHLEFLFRVGPRPPQPYPARGEDPTPDALECGSAL